MKARRALPGALACAVCLAGPAQAAAGRFIGPNVEAEVNGVLQVLSFTAIPDSTAASLSIDSGSGDDPSFQQTQFGGSFTISPETPVYLEGFLGATRYDPTFVFSGGQQDRDFSARWTGLTATGGVGYDIRLTEGWVFRPILNTTLGYVTSDLNALGFIVDRRIDGEFDFLDGGDLYAAGYGGSVMLDYELRLPEYEVDVELRYTAMRLTSFGGDSEAIDGSADGQTAALWTRLRYPTGLMAFGAPLRAVVEGAHSSFFGPNRGALGFTDLSQVGLGIEFDTEAKDILLTRTRIVGRFVFGENVAGFGIGVGASF
jgi:hypothetical protein